MTPETAVLAELLEPYLKKWGYQFANRYGRKHPEAVCYTLRAVYKRCQQGKQIKAPLTQQQAWMYANRILTVKEPMFHEKDSVNKHQELMKLVAQNAAEVFK